MTIQAIDTQYAGHRFRSRLEARWAVFFDHMGIRWEYEPQGFHCTYRLTCRDGTFPYLPDFYLPDLGLWAEVKGSLDTEQLVRLLDAAASLSSANGDGCGRYNKGAHDLVVLGPIRSFGPVPNPYDCGDRCTLVRVPTVLHMHKGSLNAAAWDPVDGPGFRYGCGGTEIGVDFSGSLPLGQDVQTPEAAIRILLSGYTLHSQGTMTADKRNRIADACAAARKARFEHGARG